MRRQPIEIAELTAAAAEDQRDPDRRGDRLDRLDGDAAGEEDRVDPGCLVGLGPLDGLVEIGDRQGTSAAGDDEVFVLARRQGRLHLADALFDRS